jgi:hypothetical protein
VDSVLKELMRYWRHFIETDIAKAYREEVTKFEKWLKETGLTLLTLRARESAEKGNPVARDYPLEYIKGLVRRGQTKYLVHRGLATQYWLIKNKLVAGGESIATWLRLLRKL